ncbi:MAG: nucleoside recognition domain-containing protein [Anaerolineae bacterium]
MTTHTAPLQPDLSPAEIVRRAEELKRELDLNFRDQLVESIYAEAESIARRAVRRATDRRYDLDQRIDRIVTSKIWGLPLMALLLAGVFWITIQGANYPSQWLATALFWVEDQGAALFELIGAPWWLTGFLWHGVYRGLAWVVSVMLPPMAIFFPLFTILEDLGYLPRVAFNVDRFFKAAGAHGKQALTMSMGLGCNAAGVTACRIIDSPRERLIAILTNNFMPCNGRWPTLIMMASLFVAAAFPPAFAALIAAGSLMLIVLIGVGMTLIVSAVLSRTFLKGEPSSFILELPPYRRPNVLQVFYTSLIDRTLLVLWRAVVMAAPAGGVIWLLSNVHVGGQSLVALISGWLDPIGRAIGLDGVILLAYIAAIPANEIVIPTILMAYTNAGTMIEIDSLEQLRQLLVGQQGWTLMTAVSLMLFSLLHNPCSTTILTIYNETKSAKWAAVSAIMPLTIAFGLLFVLNQGVRLVGLL